MGEGNKEITQTEFYRGLCLSMFIKEYTILPQCLLGVWYFGDSLPPSDGLSSKKKKTHFGSKVSLILSIRK